MLIAKETALAKEAEANKKAEKERAEKEAALKKEAEAIADKEKERAAKEAALKNESEALAKIINLVHNLHTNNLTNENISAMTGLSIAEVEAILNANNK
ncbi:MAG: hypothetical protein IPO21_21750 [Bacteroidales bacterium]|nr:hypothetical protein [Bacteroidales bacterium]